MQKKRIGVSGDQGSFSEQAAGLFAERHHYEKHFSYLITMEGVLAALNKGEIDLGVFPIVNLRGGLVRQALLAMGKYFFHPMDELWLEVHQCLLVQPGVTKEQITQVASHPQALAQCQIYLKQNFNLSALLEREDTAKAARDLAEKKLPRNCAVIAPAAAAAYGLQILVADIEDQKPNLTAFILVEAL